MSCGLVHASSNLPEWQAVKLTFFAPCQIKKYSIFHQLLHTDQISLLERKNWAITTSTGIYFKKCTNSTKFKAMHEKKESMWMILLSQKFPILEQKSLELRTLWNIFGNLLLSRPVQKILVLLGDRTKILIFNRLKIFLYINMMLASFPIFCLK